MYDASQGFGDPISGRSAPVTGDTAARTAAAVVRVPVRHRRVDQGVEPPRLGERDGFVERRVQVATLDLTAIRHPTAVLRAALRAARDVSDAELAVVRLPGTVRLAGTAQSDDGLVLDDDASGDDVRALVRDGLLPVIHDARRTLRFPRPGQEPAAGNGAVRSLLGVPIALRGGSCTLYLVNKRGGRAFTDDDVAVVQRLAAQAEISLVNALEHERALALVRELEEANAAHEEASAATSRYLAKVSHELRLPLHAILLAARLLREPAGSVRARWAKDLPETIEGSSRHMLSLIDDLVDLSRTELSDLALHPVEVDLLTLLTDVRRQVEPLARERRIRLAIAGGSGIRVTMDPVRIRQVLLNLLANAIKFTAPGGRVRLVAAIEDDGLRVSVHDTGVGIAPADIERAFEPFERLAGHGTPGAGLGLPIARRIAELHGGTLRATSAPGVGSTFTLRLPTTTGAPAGGAQPDAWTPSRSMSGARAGDRPLDRRTPVEPAPPPLAAASH